MHLFGVPEIAGLVADPNPWWVWSGDGSRLLLTNAGGLAAMGEADPTLIGAAFTSTHRFASQIATFAGLLRHDDERHQIFLTLFDKAPPRTAIIHGQRQAAEGEFVLVFRSSQRSRQNAQDAAAVFVSNAPVKLALFGPQGRLEAASASSPLARGTSFEGLFGDQTDELMAELAQKGTAQLKHAGGCFYLAMVGQSQRILLAMEDAVSPREALPDSSDDDAVPAFADADVLGDAGAPTATETMADTDILTDNAPLHEHPTIMPRDAELAPDSADNTDDTAASPLLAEPDIEPFVLTIVPQSPEGAAFPTLPLMPPAPAKAEDGEEAAIVMDLAGADMPADVPEIVASPPESAPSPAVAHRFPWQKQSVKRVLWRANAAGLLTQIDPPFTAFIGKGWAELLAHEGEAETLLRALAEGQSVAGTRVTLPVDGETRPYRISASVQLDSNGQPNGYQGFCLAESGESGLSQPEPEVVATGAGQGDEAEAAADYSEQATETVDNSTFDTIPDDGIQTPEFTPSNDKQPSSRNDEAGNGRPHPGLSLVPPSPNVVGFPGSDGEKTLLDAARAQTAVTPEQIEHNIEQLLERIKQRRSPSPDKAVPASPLQPPAAEGAADAPTGPTRRDPLNIDALMRMVKQEPPAATQAEAELRRRMQSDITNLLAALPIGVLIQRGNTVLYANETLLGWTGHADREALEHDGGDARLFAGDEADHAITHMDGTVRPVNVRLSRINWDGDKAMVYAFSLKESGAQAQETAQDATGLEDMLHEAQSRLEQVEGVLDTATDGVVVVSEDGQIESLNRSAEALFGYEAGEVQGKPFTVLFAPESHRLAVDYLDGLGRGGMASLMNDGREVTAKVRQGGFIPLHMSMGRVGTSGAVRYAAVLRDMTNWKRTERELREAKQTAENASVQKSSFLARVSHEIRTPLNAIIGFSEMMMQERFGPIGNERYKDYLRDIHTSGGHMLSLLNDLLDLTKVEAGKLDLKFEQVNLNDIAQQCVSILQPQASRDHIIIRSSLAPRLPKVVADERSMRQIITNLLSNSVKFTPEGGQVIISTAMTDDGEAVLRVRDTGIGMSEKELKMAMEPFRQIANTNPRSAGGTGLGLPLTKALVEANRARFAIVSAPQEGTLVEVYFPSMRVLAE